MTLATCPPSAQAQSLWVIYQPLIVGLVAVVLGLIANTLLEWFKQWLANKHTANVARRMLLEELRVIVEGAKTRIDTYSHEPHDESDTIMEPTWNKLQAYQFHFGNLGLLSSVEIEAVTKAYAYIQTLPVYMASMGEIKPTDGMFSMTVLPSHRRNVFLQMYKSTLLMVPPAVQLLECNLKRSWPIPSRPAAIPLV